MGKKFIKKESLICFVLFIFTFSFMTYNVKATESIHGYTYNYLTLKNIKNKRIELIVLKGREDYEDIIYDLGTNQVKTSNNIKNSVIQSYRDLRYDYIWSINYNDDSTIVTLGSDYGAFYNKWIIKFLDNTEKTININEYVIENASLPSTDITYDLNTDTITNNLEIKNNTEQKNKAKQKNAKIVILLLIFLFLILAIIVVIVLKKKKIN